MRFVAAYPITPATELLEWMAPALAKVGGTLLQAEDELASVNMIIGASYGGVPSLTATAGPGLALMTEGIGLAVGAEIPIVVVDVMRGGPSTGIPAKSEQSDLSFAVSGLHGDAPRLVLAPTSIADCVATTQWAVHLAESLQAPAIVLSDQFIGQSRAIIERPVDVDLRRPAPDRRRPIRPTTSGMRTPNPVYRRWRSPGPPASSTPPTGSSTTKAACRAANARDHAVQLDKRERKLEQFDYGAMWADVEGDGDSAVITFGSSTAAVREARGARGRAGREPAADRASPARAGAAGTACRRARGRQARARRRAEPRRAAIPLPALDVRPAGQARELPSPRSAAAAPGRARDQRSSTGADDDDDATETRAMSDTATVTTLRTAAMYKSAYKPIWCPGCGDYSVLCSLTKALAMIAVPPEKVAVVSGIGCSSRIPAYTTCYGFHGVHGRALAAATGLKVARPDLTVLVTGGDGDGYSIGGNHFLHACRRNVDLTYIVMDNHVYGMTKGQPSPTTEPDWDSKLSPGGTGVRPFHPLVIALASGANFVARAFSGDPNGTAEIIAASDPPSGLFVRRSAEPVRHVPSRSSASGRILRIRRRSRRPTIRHARRDAS